MSDTRPGLRSPRRFRNDSRSVAKLEVRLERGEELEVPAGSIVDEERQPLLDLDAPAATPPPAAPADDEVDLSKATKAQLVAAADAAGVDSSGTKAELLARLTEDGS